MNSIQGWYSLNSVRWASSERSQPYSIEGRSRYLGQFVSHVLLGLLALLRVHVQEIADSAVHRLIVGVLGSAVVVVCAARKGIKLVSD